MKFLKILFVLALAAAGCSPKEILITESNHNLQFQELSFTWDNGIPLGNGMLGALVWKNGTNLRLSLDRADLWDLRPMPNLASPEWKYKWVFEQWKKNNYKAVQVAFDRPYDELPAPTKIPAGAIEFDISELGSPVSVKLDIRNAISEVRWKNGTRLLTFIHAKQPFGWYRFENLHGHVRPKLISPPYSRQGDNKAQQMSYFDLDRLGYKQGEIVETNNSAVYTQEGWGGFKYRISLAWEDGRNSQTGCWNIRSANPGRKEGSGSDEIPAKTLFSSFDNAYKTHTDWWHNFWNASSISIPDTILEKQWYLEMYKFGSAARADAPPISLQAVWTADNGKLPPWKGDFHNDLNTQLSYWPAYSSNHIDLEEGYINWLFDNRETFRKYTKTYFEKEGLNVPGVATLAGEPMGGWIQYSFGPTVSAWLSQHFYLHWKYTMDKEFLREKAYPWISEVATFLDGLSIQGDDEKRKLPISSSPEIFNNSAQAWFPDISNFDLSLIRWTFEKAAELANELSLKDEAAKWNKILGQWPDFSIDENTGLMFTKNIQYNQSHRHFSHLMAFHPLALIDVSKGERDKIIINNTLSNLEAKGTDWWCGYSYSWLGNLYARALNGEKAAVALKTFAECFCLPNSFHVNGDQSGTGKSRMTYKPFTLEGNFACAAGIQDMLIQSHTKQVKIFPAVPKNWKNISFENLRTEGGFLVSAVRKKGSVKEIEITSLAGGRIQISNPFDDKFKSDCPYETEGSIIIIALEKGKKVKLRAAE